MCLTNELVDRYNNPINQMCWTNGSISRNNSINQMCLTNGRVDRNNNSSSQMRNGSIRMRRQTIRCVANRKIGGKNSPNNQMCLKKWSIGTDNNNKKTRGFGLLGGTYSRHSTVAGWASCSEGLNRCIRAWAVSRAEEQTWDKYGYITITMKDKIASMSKTKQQYIRLCLSISGLYSKEHRGHFQPSHPLLLTLHKGHRTALPRWRSNKILHLTLAMSLARGGSLRTV